MPSALCRTNATCRALSGLAALTLCGHLPAETENDLDTLVVSATRLPGKSAESTSAVTVLDPLELSERGILDLRQALNEVPGVNSTSTSGQTGAIGSVFLRGTATSYSQLVVDGVRLSDSTVSLGNFFSGARLDDLGRIEVLRGPHAAIHGGEAVGGVIWLETARGAGDPAARLRLEGGSFDTFNGHLSHSGAQDGFSWFLGAGYDGTHNDAIAQDFDQARTAMRLEWAQSEDLTLGMTFRATDSRFQYDFFGTNTDHTDAGLATFYANARFTPGWLARFTLGRYVERYDNDTAFGNYGSDQERTVFSTDHSMELGERHKLLAGAFWEHTDFSNTIGTANVAQRYGAHLGWEWKSTESVTADAVLRWEDYAEYEDQVTWRMGGSWQALGETRIRAGIGKAFRTPTYLDLFGTAFGAGNQNLAAEQSLGWDMGVEQGMGGGRIVSLTYFENSIDNRIRSFPTPPVNLPGETPTRGLEFAAAGPLCENVGMRLAWTWLGASLQDQPENTVTASLDWRPAEKVLLGCGAGYVAERSYGGAPLDAFLLLRIHASYALTDHVTLHARIENLADEDYELSRFGNPIRGAGFGAFTGLTASF
ncbi:TonB-dependent receptor [Akkermansiaceae bacterium]|nr:TonB-dependent receptor [Akkermansiaceae bacterium]